MVTFPFSPISYALHFLSPAAGNGLGIFAALLVLGNYGVPAKYVFSWSATKLASKRSKTMTWAYVMKGNFASALLLWTAFLALNVWEVSGGRE